MFSRSSSWARTAAFASRSLISKKRRTSEIQDKRDSELADGLPYNHLAHPRRDKRGRFPIWLPIQHRAARRIGSQSQRRKGIHDRIDPKQLHGVEDGLLLVRGDGRDECQDNGCYVDSELELAYPRLVQGEG